jgi:hypothetical protein
VSVEFVWDISFRIHRIWRALKVGHWLLAVNCNNIGTVTAAQHAHTCPKPRWRFSRATRMLSGHRRSNKWTFKRSKGLGRVSRSGKFSQKFVFERKYFTSIIFKSLNVPKKKLSTLTPEKITLKLLHVLETCFVLNFKYCWKCLAFFLVEICNKYKTFSVLIYKNEKLCGNTTLEGRSFPNFHECWYNCISIRKKCFIFVLWYSTKKYKEGNFPTFPRWHWVISTRLLT